MKKKHKAIVTVKHGCWGDPAIWRGGKIPTFSGSVIVKHRIKIDMNFEEFITSALRENRNGT